MNRSEFFNEEIPDAIVTLNISETNITINGSRAKTFMKTPDRDTSVNNIIIGIGVVAVALIVLCVILKLIWKCYRMYKEDDDDDMKEPAKVTPLLPQRSPNMMRRKSSIRDPTAPLRRSSLHIETQMELRQKRLSQQYENTPPIIKKS